MFLWMKSIEDFMYYLDTDVHPVTLKTANATVSVSNEIGKSDFTEYPYGHGAVTKDWKMDNSTAGIRQSALERRCWYFL